MKKSDGDVRGDGMVVMRLRNWLEVLSPASKEGSDEGAKLSRDASEKTRYFHELHLEVWQHQGLFGNLEKFTNLNIPNHLVSYEPT